MGKAIFFLILLLSLSRVNKLEVNLPPIETEKVTLDRENFWITSSMSSHKKKDTLCKYKDYWLKRKYTLISKRLKKSDRSINQLIVYVKNNDDKWNGERASEEFQSIKVFDASIKLWNKIFVGMKRDELINLIYLEEYHIDNSTIKMYTNDFESTFLISKGIINQVEVKRRCK